ncbi:MAG: hypothetical protein NWE89_05685 [Candidatus Bathyarchaeota archaeon]|nr:hypothetical protein [Candidatus Bathyarchaeota archaeon]
MQCPECSTELKKDGTKWMSVINGLEERTLALYYCSNQACSLWERPVCKNVETDEPYDGPVIEEHLHLLETNYI